jgi:hypothetical protein
VLELLSSRLNVLFNINNIKNILSTYIYENTIATKEICNKLFDLIDKIKIDIVLSERPPTPDFSKGF